MLEVHLGRGSHRTADVRELRQYAAEERNPDNVKGVTSLELFLPFVREGVRFLDTPGVGSLSTSGPAQTFAALPRCDLGFVLVSAGAPGGPDDIALVRMRGSGVRTGSGPTRDPELARIGALLADSPEKIDLSHRNTRPCGGPLNCAF